MLATIETRVKQNHEELYSLIKQLLVIFEVLGINEPPMPTEGKTASIGSRLSEIESNISHTSAMADQCQNLVKVIYDALEGNPSEIPLSRPPKGSGVGMYEDAPAPRNYNKLGGSSAGA